MIYEQGYKDMRHAINTVLYTKETGELATCMEVSHETGGFYGYLPLLRVLDCIISLLFE